MPVLRLKGARVDVSSRPLPADDCVERLELLGGEAPVLTIQFDPSINDTPLIPVLTIRLLRPL